MTILKATWDHLGNFFVKVPWDESWDFWNRSWEFWKNLESFSETVKIFLFLDIALKTLEIYINWNVQFWKIICLGKLWLFCFGEINTTSSGILLMSKQFLAVMKPKDTMRQNISKTWNCLRKNSQFWNFFTQSWDFCTFPVSSYACYLKADLATGRQGLPNQGVKLAPLLLEESLCKDFETESCEWLIPKTWNKSKIM